MTKQRTICLRLSGIALLLSSVLIVLSCAKPGSEGASSLAENAGESVGCKSFESDFYDQLYQFPVAHKSLPSEQDMRAAFSRSVQGGHLQDLTAGDQVRVSEELTNLYRLLAVDSVQKIGKQNSTDQEKLALLAALEIGDASTPEKEEIQGQIKAEFSKIDQLVGSTGAKCSKAPSNTAPAIDGAPSPDIAKSGTLFSQWKATGPSVLYGALKVMSTAYQSCSAGVMPALDKSTPDVHGVTIVGNHPDGIGLRRLITNIDDVLKSHPYLHNYRKPSSRCYDVTKNLPIYDYGGRPATSTGTFDLFKSSGSGTSALGTDCSGYVYMAIASGGLRVKKSATMKAVAVNGITSTMFTNPQKNGLTCFDYANFKNNDNLKSGDIIAKAGHVVIVQAVGSDPFGIKDIRQESDCLLSNMSLSRFDFTLIQDSPDKGGVGIQSSKAADYLLKETVMPEGLLEAAVTACQAKFGKSAAAKNQKIAIVRHAGTSECSNGSEVKMAYESCVAACPAFAPQNQLASAQAE